MRENVYPKTLSSCAVLKSLNKHTIKDQSSYVTENNEKWFFLRLIRVFYSEAYYGKHGYQIPMSVAPVVIEILLRQQIVFIR